MKTTVAFFISVSLAGFLTGCSTAHSQQNHTREHEKLWEKVDQAIAVIHPTAGNRAHGTVRFIESGNQVKVVASIGGLNPNQKHAIHIHEYGDCSAPDATSAGSHYNPQGHPHGLVSAEERHAGDLGNLQADATGRAHYEITVDNITIAGLKNPIIGRAVIVHAKEDEGTQPVGNAGARIGCGVIGVASPPKQQQ